MTDPECKDNNITVLPMATQDGEHGDNRSTPELEALNVLQADPCTFRF